MRKVFSSGLIVLAGAAAISPQQAAPRAPWKMEAADPRLAILRNFFQKFDCPAEAYARDFLSAADTYRLDWRLLPSISFVESAGGKTALNNNMFGWDNGRAQFDSPVAGIYQVGYQLAYSDTYRDKDLDRVLAVYNPVGPYARSVKSVMRQIAPLQ
jgi:hypothetical protein